MTSIVLKMEGDLNSFENGRRHHFFYMEDDLSFSVMEGDLKFFENGRQHQFLKMKDDLNKKKKNERQTLFLSIKDDLIFFVNGRFLSNYLRQPDQHNNQKNTGTIRRKSQPWVSLS